MVDRFTFFENGTDNPDPNLRPNVWVIGHGGDVAFYVTSGHGETITAGSLRFETALKPDFPGEWAPIGSPIDLDDLSGGKTHVVAGEGPYECVRARFVTPIPGPHGVLVTGLVSY